MMAAVAYGATLNVPSTEYPTIQAAINAASDGDTILVAAGTYYESIVIDKSLTIKSLDGPDATILNGNSSTENYYMVIIDADNVTFNGFTVTNPIYSGSADASGVVIGYTYTKRPKNARVLNCKIHDIGTATRYPVSFGTFGINCGPVDGLEVSKCEIYNIKNNDSDAYAIGIFSWGNSADDTADNLVFLNNSIHDIVNPVVARGIAIGGDSANAQISGNTIYGPVKDGITTSAYLDPGKVTITNNTVKGATNAGILLRSTYQQTLTGNTIKKCGTGILVDATSGVPTIKYNSLSGNTTGLENKAASQVIAENNWWGNTTGQEDLGDKVVGDVDYTPWLNTPAIHAIFAGRRLAETQNSDGGWGWPLTGSSAANTIGPIGMGLCKAYEATGDPDMLPAINKVAGFLQSKTNNFSPPDGYLAAELDKVLGGTTNVTYVKTNFYDKLAAGTYYRPDGSGPYTTAGYVNLIRTSRASQGIPNLAAWDVGMGLVGAVLCGASTSEWIAGVQAEIAELDYSKYYDVIGLAGALYGLKTAGVAIDPSLAEKLTSFQIAESGGFTWNSNYVIPFDWNECIQETAYASLALDAIGGYGSVVVSALRYINSNQLGTGGWEGYVGDPYGENNEISAEGSWAIALQNKLYLDVAPASLYVKPGETVNVTIKQKNLTEPVVGYQAFLGFESSKLSITTGDITLTTSPYPTEIYKAVGSGTIDLSAGATAETTVDADLASLSFTVPSGTSDTTTKIIFRASDPPSYFSDIDGCPVWATLSESQTIVIDGTAPTGVNITADPATWTNGNTVTLTFSAADALSGIDHYELSLNGGAFTPETSPYVWDVSSLSTGVYTATVKAVDKAGNEATASTSVYIDRTAPSLDILSAKQGTPGAPFNASGFTYTKVLSGGNHVFASAAFSPDGKKIVFIDRSPDGTREIKLYDRESGSIETLMGYKQGDKITVGEYGPYEFWGFGPPYFSADGTKIGWATGFSDAAGVAEVYDIASDTITHYYPGTETGEDFYNTDFFGSYTDQWVGWDYGEGGGADIFLYTLSGDCWNESANLTNTGDYKEYEPDSNAAGTKILYWSGETTAEPLDTTHLLVKNGSSWNKDTGFTPIAGSTWPYWSRDENEIGVTKYDASPGYGKGDLYVYDSAGNFKFDLTGPAVGQGSYWQFFGFNFAVGPAGAGREYLFTSGAANTQGGRDVWIAKVSSDPELIYSYRTGTPFATQGKVYIKVTASDANSGLAGVPNVTVKDFANATMPVTYIGESPAGTFIYSVDVLASTANGKATVTVEATDNVGNTAVDTDYFDINKSTAAVTIKLQSVNTPTTRWIKFTLGGNGGTVAPVTFERQLSFDSTGTACVVLEGIPTTANWTRISAKDEQHTLRNTVNISGGAASLTLRGGDATNDNLIDILDFGVFAGQYGTVPDPASKWPTKNANFDCSGSVGITDFSFISTQFLARGDALPGYATADASVPRKSITVNELAKIIGVVSAKKADLNYDGVVDQTDMALFAKQNAR